VNSLNLKITQFFNQVKKFLTNFRLLIRQAWQKITPRNKQISSNGKQTKLDKKLVFSLAKTRIPRLKQLKYIRKFLSWQEAWLINLSILIILASATFLTVRFYQTHLQVIPIGGGEYSEGLIGTLSYINPLYAPFSDVDQDITNLVFSSLFKRDRNGELVNDLAESYQISEDNKIYTIKIKQGVEWHNNVKLTINQLTVDDILFTFYAIQDKQYQSPWRASFTGVKLEKVDETTIRFILAEPYAAFLDLLTFGILPQELWQLIPANTANLAKLNLNPVGSGPYKFDSLVKDETGVIRSFSLVRNDNYYNQAPYIDKLVFKFLPNFAEAAIALNEGLIEGISYLPLDVKDNIVAQDALNYYQLNLPQLTAIFLNQNIEILKDKKVRQALITAIDKNKIINQILAGEARLINGPILPNSFAYNPEVNKYQYNPEEAAQILDNASWQKVEITEGDITKAEEDLTSEDEATRIKAENKILAGAGEWRSKNNQLLIIKLTVIDNQENAQIAQAIQEFWQAANIRTVIELIPANQIQAQIIKPRNYQALLYSEVVGADPDPYPFWHSSQIGENGLNITDYKNKEVDALLEDARLTNDLAVRKEKYKRFQEIISQEAPAVFLYSPIYTYVQAKKIKGFDVKNILIPRDRFANISEWYIKTGKKLVWE